ncbi:MAG: hypothetical protein WA324_08685 [Bryobacteraceae bacterium]
MAARLSRSIVVFALLLSATLASPPSFRANTNLVLCSARVLDQKRRPVLHLEKESFQLFDNGEQPIIVFDQRSDSAFEAPLHSIEVLVNGHEHWTVDTRLGYRTVGLTEQ